jgi:uncharacterized protein (TIGR03086 family)
MSEISGRFRDLAVKFTARVDAVPGDRWSSPSPCQGWTTRDVVGHMVGNCSTLLGLIGREVPSGPSVDGAPREAWAIGRDAVQAALDEPAIATLEYHGAMGTGTFEQAVARFGFLDLVVHSWDLARAAGLDDRLDPVDVHATFELAKPMDEMLRTPGVCGPKLDAPADADEQTKLLAFLGRSA